MAKLIARLVVYLFMIGLGISFYMQDYTIEMLKPGRSLWIKYLTVFAGVGGSIYTLFRIFRPEDGFIFKLGENNISVIKVHPEKIIRTVNVDEIQSLHLKVIESSKPDRPVVKLMYRSNEGMKNIFVDDRCKIPNIDVSLQNLGEIILMTYPSIEQTI